MGGTPYTEEEIKTLTEEVRSGRLSSDKPNMGNTPKEDPTKKTPESDTDPSSAA